QLSWWQVQSGGVSLTVQVFYQLTHGRLFELPLWVPADWEVDRVEMAAAGLRNWQTLRDLPPGLALPPELAGKPGSLLLVELQRPLDPPGPSERPKLSTDGNSWRGKFPSVLVRLRSKTHRSVPAHAAVQLPLPLASPLGARSREGLLAVDFDEQLFS